MYVAILGRQPQLGTAELEKIFGSENVKPISNEAAILDSLEFDIQRLGGVLKAGKITVELQKTNWNQTSQKIIQYYSDVWQSHQGKITLGISAYGFSASEREVQKTGIILKRKLKQKSISLRLIPNTEPALSTAVSHHNKLGLSANKVEIIVVRADDNTVYVAESTGSQNITSYARRDRERPRRDAFVGMLPPKLAQIMINLAIGQMVDSKWDMVNGINKPTTILDPFCGTGVVLQEALLMGYPAYGTDLSEKIISYSSENLKWLSEKYRNLPKWQLSQGDAMKTKWERPIGAVVSETYLGQPFSAPPSPTKLDEVVKNCNHIVTEFLKNLSGQIESGTPLCIAVPAWRDKDGNFAHLPLVAIIARLGYKPHEFKHVSKNDLIYYRPDQIVARELLVLTKI